MYKMKKIVLILSALFLLANPGFTQIKSEKPERVARAAFFDETPPLREMKIILPGERDRSWKDDIIPNESLEKNLDKKYGPKDAVTIGAQEKFGDKGSRGPVENFDGVGNVNGVYPPDTDGDVGPDHYFQMINLSFAIFDKSGELLYGPVDNSTLWEGFIGPWTGTNDGDPIVLYDEEADRWVATQFAVNLSNGKSYELVAVSQTPDPLGEYYRYAFEFDQMNDYPKVGVWNDGYYTSYHMFSGGYVGAAFAVLERDKMLVGDSTARMVYFGEYPSIYGVLPADFDGTPPPAGTPGYFMDMSYSQNIEIYELDVDWNNPLNSTFSNAVTLSPTAYSTAVDGIPQPNTSTKLDDLAGMLMYRLQYRNFGSYETMVTNHTIRYYGRAAIRWYELRRDNADWYIYQEGSYSPNPQHRWMGSIAMNANGEIALGFSISDADSTYPSIRYTGRSANAPLGEMNYDEIEVKKGGSSQSGINRWGDYSAMSVDPSNDSTFWYTQEYRKNSGWGTWITSFDFSPPQQPTVDAGENDTICAYSYANLSADATYQQSVEWVTEGDGIFASPNTLSTTYAHGSQDLENGEVELTITAYGFGEGLEASDSVKVFFNNNPEVDAGADTIICVGDYVILDGYALNYSSIQWQSEGDGLFENDTLLSTVYFPGDQDILDGAVDIELIGYPVPPCEDEETDELSVTIDECTGMIQTQKNPFEVSIVPNPVKDVFTYKISGLQNIQTRISIIDISGLVVFQHVFVANDGKAMNQIDMSGFSDGTYIFRVEQNALIENRKILLQ